MCESGMFLRDYPQICIDTRDRLRIKRHTGIYTQNKEVMFIMWLTGAYRHLKSTGLQATRDWNET
jgi:hypothetical protein